MKTTASILLLAILTFNWVGYRFVSGILERKADATFISEIDKADYDEASLIEIKVPLNAPYLSGNSADFERYDGELEIEGVHYRYVKRKIVDGELVLLCLPNQNKNRVQNSSMDFFRLVNDLNHSTQGKEKNSSSIKSFVTEYKQEKNSWTIAAFQSTQQQSQFADISFTLADYSSIHKRPPRA